HRSARIGDLAVDGAGGGADGGGESWGREPEAEEKHKRGNQAVQPPHARPPWIEYTERTRNPPPPRKNFEFARTLHLNPGPAQSDFVRSRRLSGGRAGSWIVEQQGSVRLDDSRRRIERHANRLDRAIRPADADGVDRGSVPEANRDRQLGLRQVPSPRHDRAPERLASGLDLDGRANRVTVGSGAGQRQTNPVMARPLIVTDQSWWPGDGRQDEIEIAVSVDVCDRDTPRHHRTKEVRRLLRGRGHEGRARGRAGIPEQMRRLLVLLTRLHPLALLPRV